MLDVGNPDIALAVGAGHGEVELVGRVLQRDVVAGERRLGRRRRLRLRPTILCLGNFARPVLRHSDGDCGGEENGEVGQSHAVRLQREGRGGQARRWPSGGAVHAAALGFS